MDRLILYIDIFLLTFAIGINGTEFLSGSVHRRRVSIVIVSTT